jgi:hypothetical protein
MNMKYLILILLLFTGRDLLAASCINQIAQSEALDAIAMKPGVGAKKCGDLDPCLCYDGIHWEYAVLVDTQMDDISKPIFSTPVNVQSCASDSACKTLIQDHCPNNASSCAADQMIRYCTAPDKALYREASDGSGLQAYCTHVTGYQKKTVKQLQNDAAKKAAWDAQKQASADAAATKAAQVAALKARLKALAAQPDMTAADLKEAIMKLLKTKVLQKELD